MRAAIPRECCAAAAAVSVKRARATVSRLRKVTASTDALRRAASVAGKAIGMP